MQNKKLNIAFNIDHFMPHRGGAERYLLNLVTYLLQCGHTVHVFAMDGEHTLEHKNFHFHKIPVLSWFRWLKSLIFIINSSRAIKRQHSDIVHVLGKNLTMNVFQPHGGSHRAWFKQNCLSVSIHKPVRILYAIIRCIDLKLLLFFIVESLQLRKDKMPHILAISQCVAEDLKTLYAVPTAQVTVIENGIDCKKFSLDVRSHYRISTRQSHGLMNKKVVLFIGNNFRLKGLRYFLQTVQKLAARHNDIAALIIGSGNYKKFHRYASLLGIEKICAFIPQTDAIEHFYSAADVLIAPTFYDPFGLVIPEALACGLPVITTRFCGAYNMIQPAKTGNVVPSPEEVEEMARYAEKFLYDIDAEECAETAHASVQCYDNSLVFGKICDYYYSILGQGGGGVG